MELGCCWIQRFNTVYMVVLWCAFEMVATLSVSSMGMVDALIFNDSVY